jgi:hypothetical protein
MDVNKLVKDLEKKGYSEVGAQTDQTWDFDKDPQLEGVFIEKQTGVGQNNSNIYVFEGQDNARYGVWGSSVLDARLKNLVVGEEVVIVYLGKEKSEKTGRTYKNFKVFHKGGVTQPSQEEPPLEAYEEEDYETK